MGWQHLARLGALLSTAVAAATAVAAEDPPSLDEQAIRAAARDYLAALTKGDPAALAACWIADGEFVDASGQVHPAGELAAELKQAGGARGQARVTGSKIRFLTPDVALEDGTSEVVWPRDAGLPTARGRFHATWVKQQGRWRLARLWEIADDDPAASPLSDLDWLVGNWAAQAADGVTIEATVRWNDAGTFLLRDSKAVQGNQVLLRATQRIGRDPASGKLMSWSFDADGGHSEAVWTRDGDTWVEHASGVLPDGRTTSATAILTFDGKNGFSRKVLAARVQGEPVTEQELHFTRSPAVGR